MNNDYGNMHLALQQLKAQGMDTKQLEAVVRQQQAKAMENSMSKSDGIYIEQAQPDVPGFYIDEYTKQQDAYANAVAMQNQRREDPAINSNMNAPVNPIVSPNYQVVQGPQRVTVGPRGELIYL